MRAVIIGGGILGLEAANTLLEKGLDVTIIEFQNRILPMQLDAEGSALLEKIITNKDINLLLGYSVSEILGDTKAIGVKLAGGEEIATDMIIISAGVRPNIDIAKATGLKTNRGIVVNDKMETSIGDIYACGDVAELDGRMLSLWMPALEQGKAAGANAVGDNVTYKNEEAPALLQAFGTQIYSIGDIGRMFEKQPELEEDYQFIKYENQKQNIYKKLYLKDEKLVGGILIGDLKNSLGIRKGINNGIGINEARTLI